jgi:hypothetical protein
MSTINYKPRQKKEDYNGPLSWVVDKETNERYFCGEISELRDISDLGRTRLSINSVVTVRNTATGNEIVFKCVKVDGDEDVYGWNFVAIKGNTFPVTMLIIND